MFYCQPSVSRRGPGRKCWGGSDNDIENDNDNDNYIDNNNDIDNDNDNDNDKNNDTMTMTQ